MIYITGDTHGVFLDLTQRVERKGIKPEDTVIVCGDFGFVWGDETHNKFLERLAEQPYTIAFVDGNHENFDMLYSYPVVDLFGGKAHKVSENIYHLMRGECFEIEGHSFFCFGGAYSIDKISRLEGVSWWPQERPNNAEYDHAKETLERIGYKVDYVLTHTLPESIIYRLGILPDIHDAELTGYLEWLYRELDFKQWFAGHFHENRDFDKLKLLYEDVVTV